MSMKDCKDIRQEIDQATSADQQTETARAHLRGCPDCSKFAAENRALQGMLAGLGTVAAPADFDFRLRARLAREKSAGNGGAFASFLRQPRSLGVAALVLVLVAGGIAIKNWLAATPPSAVTANQGAAPVNPTQAVEKPVPEPAPKVTGDLNASTVKGSENATPSKTPNRGPRSYALVDSRPERKATRDAALSSAPVFTRDEMNTGGPIVQVPLDDEVMRISIDDGRGSRRTVSLPTFSFGSQRLTGQTFVPVSSKGVW
ncbi:MAG TPA: hypothetical protein VN643_14285 [Pyrinomonadaceae bacterium]|nr:hypothetical protein [Pyrinomonadaceae bacterium]